MRAYLLLILMLALLFGATPAYAETYAWDAADDGGIPKGVVGYDGIQCVGEVRYGGHHVRLTNYVGADAGWMATQPARERAWQQAECRSMMRDHMRFVFAVRWGVALPDDAPITITTRSL